MWHLFGVQRLFEVQCLFEDLWYIQSTKLHALICKISIELKWLNIFVEGAEEENDSGKVHKQRPSRGSLVITRPNRASRESGGWRGWEEDVDSPDEGSGLDWEDQGELDFEKQLELEKRRQHLKRELALMDQEDAAKDDTIETSFPHDNEPTRHVPIVHSRLHPAPSQSLSDETSQPPVQPTKVKKKKKADQKVKKSKKIKTLPGEKDGNKVKAVQARSDNKTHVENQPRERARKISSSGSEGAHVRSRVTPAAQTLEDRDSDMEERVHRSEHKKISNVKGQLEERQQLTPPPEEMPLQHKPRTPSDGSSRKQSKVTPGSEQRRAPMEKSAKRRTAVSPPEGQQYQDDDRFRRTSEPSDDLPLPRNQTYSPPYEHQYDSRGEASLGGERRRGDESPGTIERKRAFQDTRHRQEVRGMRTEDQRKVRRQGPVPGSRRLTTPSPDRMEQEISGDQYQDARDKRRRQEWVESPSESDKHGTWKPGRKPPKGRMLEEQRQQEIQRQHRQDSLSSDDDISHPPLDRSRQQVKVEL